MSIYENVLSAVDSNGTGIRECNQGTFLGLVKTYGNEGLGKKDWGGICRGLVGVWLIDKKEQEAWSFGKKPDSFWTVFSESSNENTSLFKSTKTSREALGLQRAYRAGEQNFEEYLREAGLARVNEDDKEWVQDIHKDLTLAKIAGAVLSNDSRFYRLSIKLGRVNLSYKAIKRLTEEEFDRWMTGDLTVGHALGVFREWGFSKTTTTFLFDPNVGEFQLYNDQGLQSALAVILRWYKEKYELRRCTLGAFSPS